MSPIRILLIDDHAMFRSGLGVLLHSSLENLQVLEAGSLDAALYDIQETPDLLLLDILLHGLNGLEGIALLKRRWPQTPIIMLSSDASPETISDSLARGATAFVSKEKSAETILSVVRQVLVQLHPNKPVPASTSTTSTPGLTPRQLEVLNLLCQGLPNKAIGLKLDLSENTVRWHVQAILGFLQVSNRSEAAFAARRKGLIS